MARGESPYQGRYVVPDVDFSGFAEGKKAIGAGLSSATAAVMGGMEKGKERKGKVQGMVSFIEQLKKRPDQEGLSSEYEGMLTQLKDEESPLSQRAALADQLERNVTLSSVIEGTQSKALANDLAGKVQELMVEKQRLENELTEARTGDVTEDSKTKTQTRLQEAAKFPLVMAGLGQDVILKGLDQQEAEQRIALNEALKGPAKKQAKENLKNTRAERQKIKAETAKLGKEMSALAGKGGSFIQATDPNGENIDNVFFPRNAEGKQSFTPYLMLPGEPPRPLSSSPSELNSEMRLRLKESRDAYGSESAGTFTDFGGFPDHKLALSIEQLYDVLKFKRPSDEDDEWKYDDSDEDGNRIVRRYNREQLENLTPKTKELLRKYTDRRTRIQALPGEDQSPVGEDDDLSEGEMDEELNKLYK